MTNVAISRLSTGDDVRGTALSAVCYREFLLLTRNRTNLLLAILPTAIYLLFFSTSLTHLVGTVQYDGHAVGYAAFTIPAIMLSSMLAATTTTGTSLFQEEMGGMSLELWSYPLHRASYIGGKVLSTTALVLLQSIAALGIGALLFNLGWPLGHWMALLVATVAAALAFNGLYLLIASLLHDFQRFMVLINVLGPFLLFSSPSFYPSSQMPVPLRWVALVNPVSYGIKCLRGAALDGWGAMWPSGLALVLAASLLFTGITAVLNRRASGL
jgi:ABC-2 type transport system permease protein